MIDYEKLEKHRLMQIDENRYMSKRMDEHEKCIGVLQSLVNDLRWRMNEVCTLLSLKREEVGWMPTASCCSVHAGGYEECKTECQHESDGVVYFSNPGQYRCVKCGEYYK